MPAVDVVVVGGGIAGVSAGAFAARAGASVVLLEREPTLSVHSTGRSAALYLPNYGMAQTRTLTVLSRSFLDDPPVAFTDTPLLATRGMLWVGGPQELDLLRDLLEAGTALDPHVQAVSGAQARALCPVLRPACSAAGVLEPAAADIDVAALHAGFVRMLRSAGGRVHRGGPVTGVTPGPRGWSVRTSAGVWDCSSVINAAGAWGDQVAALAGIRPVGLRPLRRTAITVGVPDGVDARRWPAVHQVRQEWYFKPEGDGLLLSPADQTPSEPVDARATDLDVALVLERVAAATTLPLRSVRAAWAGLRTFAPDGELVIGPDPVAPGFVWCVGQGGYGIQSSPAAGRLAAELALGIPSPWATSAGLDLRALAPDRLRGPTETP